MSGYVLKKLVKIDLKTINSNRFSDLQCIFNLFVLKFLSEVKFRLYEYSTLCDNISNVFSNKIAYLGGINLLYLCQNSNFETYTAMFFGYKN